MSIQKLLLIPCALIWLWTLAQCLKRKQYIWFAVVLLTFIVGAVAFLIVFWVRRENSKAPSQITTRPPAGMNRPASYLLIVFGAPLGYVASYFGQPGVIRMFMSLGDYVGQATNILNDPPGLSRLPASVCQTAWIGVILGMALMAIFAMIMSSRNRS